MKEARHNAEREKCESALGVDPHDNLVSAGEELRVRTRVRDVAD